MWGERRFRFTEDLLTLMLIYTQVMSTRQMHE